MNICETLIRLRKQQGISQEALADMLGVSRQAVSKWETGAALPELSNVEKLCAIFDVTPNELLGYGESVAEAPQSPTQGKKPMPRALQTAALALICILFGVLIGLMAGGNGSGGDIGQIPSLEISRYELSPMGLIYDDGGERATRFQITFYPEQVVSGVEYSIVVTTPHSGSKSYPASMENGVCSACFPLSHSVESATVSVCIDSGEIHLNETLVKVYSLTETGYLFTDLQQE